MVGKFYQNTDMKRTSVCMYKEPEEKDPRQFIIEISPELTYSSEDHDEWFCIELSVFQFFVTKKIV